MICCQVMRSRAKSSISNLPFIHHPQLDPKWFQTLKLIVAANLQHHSHTHRTSLCTSRAAQRKFTSHKVEKKRALFNCSGESCVLRCIIRPTLIAVNEINFQLINLFASMTTIKFLEKLEIFIFSLRWLSSLSSSYHHVFASSPHRSPRASPFRFI